MIKIEQILSRLEQVKPHDNSRYYSAICPFHDDTKPSLLVYRDNWFRCLACGAVGDYERLWRAINGNPIRPIPQEKEIGENYETQKYDETFAYHAHQSLLKFRYIFGWYLRLRGVENRIESCRLGWWNGWYTIPVYDEKDRYEGIILRAGKHVQEATGLRYFCPKKQPPLFYVPDWYLLKISPVIFVVYGMFDALALSAMRYPVCTTTSGKDSFNPLWLERFRKLIVVLPDKGEEEAARKLAASLGWRGKVQKLNYPEDIKDPAGFLEIGKPDLLRVQIIRWMM